MTASRTTSKSVSKKTDTSLRTAIEVNGRTISQVIADLLSALLYESFPIKYAAAIRNAEIMLLALTED